MIIAMLAALLLLQQQPMDRLMPLDPVGGGVCAGPVWVALDRGERAMISHLEYGGILLAFAAPRNRWWYLYLGPQRAARIDGPGFRLRGVEFRHIVEAGTIHLYTARLPDGTPILINGAPFTGGRNDAVFAARIHFGADRPAACNRNDQE